MQLVCIQTNCKLQTNCNIQTNYKLQTFGLNYKPRLIVNYRLLALIINYRIIPWVLWTDMVSIFCRVCKHRKTSAPGRELHDSSAPFIPLIRRPTGCEGQYNLVHPRAGRGTHHSTRWALPSRLHHRLLTQGSSLATAASREMRGGRAQEGLLMVQKPEWVWSIHLLGMCNITATWTCPVIW